MTKRTIYTIVFLIVAAIIIIILTATFRNPSVAKPTRTTSQGSETLNPTGATSTGTVSSEKTYTLADVAKHKSQTDCWTAVRGSVYNLSPFVNQHPGGVANIMKICGIDGTAAFEGQHGGQPRPENELASLKIGTLVK
ncbi:MAG: uncharacterized protein JWO73_540 [Candidatus Taylorbacteria bacterium]|nr:uncharacterized protein [Candidatus Taylorbacteria bacterium]